MLLLIVLAAASDCGIRLDCAIVEQPSWQLEAINFPLAIADKNRELNVVVDNFLILFGLYIGLFVMLWADQTIGSFLFVGNVVSIFLLEIVFNIF